MFCHRCGQSLAAGANFCPSCGASANPNVFTASPLHTLYRPRSPRVFAGVCSALHLRFGWDLTATRLLAALMGVLLFPVGEIAYLVAWLVIPEEVATVPPSTVAAPSTVVAPNHDSEIR